MKQTFFDENFPSDDTLQLNHDKKMQSESLFLAIGAKFIFCEVLIEP